MGQTYHLTEDQDDLLTEAERAFDLSARRQAVGWCERQNDDAFEARAGRFNFLAGWLHRSEGEKHTV